MQGHIRRRTYTTKTGKQTVNWYVVVDLGRDANDKRRQKWHGGFKTRKEAEVARTKIVGTFTTARTPDHRSSRFENGSKKSGFRLSRRK